ncbi:OLC1v1006594C1 [Oldenlandia corymbosa var. corymbosa]|uniref:OLC1v1006594C1 n=1 Tax=Oldenlandia corymbosa var. corymbosa TaxID=529605 RepID=A0AAV1DHE4_OLDCO|nr:OLC1v1006594C1 [Oldenlandia corymbosa var. corymbosa]
MASNITAYIDSVLHNLQLLVQKTVRSSNVNKHYLECMLNHLRFMLKNLKMFALSTGQLEDDMEDTVCRIAKFVDTLYNLVSGGRARFAGHVEVIHYFSEQANKCYFQQILVDYQSSFRDYAFLKRAMNALEEQILFLKSFILFATRDVVESKENLLLAHAGEVTIDAAFLFLKDRPYVYNEFSEFLYIPLRVQEEMLSEISTLIQKIQPIDPRVCMIYTKALDSSKLVTRLLCAAESIIDVRIAPKEFISSFLGVLWELLSSGHPVTVPIPVKGQLQELYEGLRFLRIKLFGQKQPNVFDVKMKEDIRDLMCDAGVLIFPFYQTQVQLDLELLQHLVEAIQVIRAKFGDKDPKVPKSSTQLAFLDFLLERLMELTTNEADLDAKTHTQTIRNELIHLRSFLGDTVELQNNDQEEIEALWGRVLEVAFKVEDIINYLMVGNIPQYASTLSHSIMKDIGNIWTEVQVKAPGIKLKREGIKVKEVTMTNRNVPSITPSINANMVVGFHQEAISIIDRLTRGAKKLQVVSIVGRPGIGKTTLAEKVYNDPCITYHFSACALTTVSQTIDSKRVLLELLKQVAPDKCSLIITSETTADDVANQLRRSLKQKRYLIVLDDIWEAKAWHSLQQAFPDDSMGSRILLTSRSYEVAPSDMLDEKPHELRPLNEEESLELFQMKSSAGSAESPALGDLRRQILQVCKGLPLKIVVVAGLLKSSEPEEWNKVLESLSSSNVSESFKDTLELSYRHLPEHLKPCLLYLATFREDQQVSVKRLLYLWMAEGFIRKVEMKRLLDVAEEYLNDLIGRSLVMVTKKKSTGGIRTCRIHDLLHEFCSQKVQVEHFFHFLQGDEDELSLVKEPRHPWRLSMNSGFELLLNSKIYWFRVCSLRVCVFYKTLQENISVMYLRIWRYLRVLDLEEVKVYGEIPSEIGLLVLLAMFAIGSYGVRIPTSVGDLSNLETLIISGYYGEEDFCLPITFWNLKKLKHLYMKLHFRGGLPIENLDDSCYLYELDRISGVIFPHDWRMERVVKMFPNIRKLKCRIRGFDDNHAGKLVQIAAPVSLCQLKSLNISVDYNKLPEGIMFELSFPANLKKLSLSGIPLSKKCLSSIGKLPNLEVLKLEGIVFEGDTWAMEEEEFYKLRILKLNSRWLHWWNAPDDQVMCLEDLELSDCLVLKEMPSCLGTLETLQMIKVIHCGVVVETLVKKIEDLQVEFGNSDLKVMIQSRRKNLEHDKRWTSFLANIGNSVRRVAKLIDSYRVDSGGGRELIMYFVEKTTEWKPSLLAAAGQSNSFSTDEMLETIGYYEQNVADYLDRLFLIAQSLQDEMKALGEQMIFLKSFILFATQGGNVKPIQDLLAHAGAVTIEAAYILLKDGAYQYDGTLSGSYHIPENVSEGMLSKIQALIGKIKPTDPRACEIYAKSLHSSKSATSLPCVTNRIDVVLPPKELFGCFLFVLWELLPLDHPMKDLIPVKDLFPVKDQLQELYEGLRFLRMKLFWQKQANIFPVNVKEEIRDLMCDAGVFIFPLYQAQAQVDLNLLENLLEALKDVEGRFEEKDPEVPKSSTHLAFLDFLLEELMELTISDASSKSHAETIRNELSNLRSLLAHVVESPNHDKQEIQDLWVRGLEVAFKVERIINYLLAGDIPQHHISTLFDSIVIDIRNILQEIEEIIKRQKVTRRTNSRVRSTTTTTTPSIAKRQVVGFDHDAESVINRLKNRAMEKLQIVSIVGMSGIGKTTLAEKVYDHPSIFYHFSARAITGVSQKFDRKRVLLELLNQVNHTQGSLTYLIVLDDIWDADAWSGLKLAFPDDRNGSRILLTTRKQEAVAELDKTPHKLRSLNEKESFKLFRMKLSTASAESPALDTNFRRQVFQISNGLPLDIGTVAGLLNSTAPKEWNKVLETLRSRNSTSKDKLELSYSNLPEHLKQCLLYLATSREDQQVSVKRLLYLWMAEGFIRKAEMKRALDVAEGYLNDLTVRNLLMVTKNRSRGGKRTCRIHDLLRECCLQKVQDEPFFHFIEGGYEALSAFKEPRHPWRLCINSGFEHVLDSKVYWPRLRSLRVSLNNKPMKTKISVMHLRIWKFVRVLDLEQMELCAEIPSEIRLLVLLAFFAIRGYSLKIPDTIGGLSNLETLIIGELSSDKELSLPVTVRNLQKLKHLYMNGVAPGVLHIDNLDHNSPCSSWEFLDRVSGVILPSDWRMERVMKMFPNIRKLKCRIQGFDNSHAGKLVQIAALVSLAQLKSLNMSVDKSGKPEGIKFELSFPANLEKLSLSGIPLSKKCLSSIGKLPNLGVLKLEGTDFEGDTLTMEEEEFSELRILELSNSRWLKSWSASEDQLRSLEELELRDCLFLNHLPSCLETCPALQMIKVIRCPKVVERVKQIEELQEEFGNSDLKVII